MYTVKLDLHLTYTPPMREATPPIVLTRDLVLPFPAADGMKVHSEAMDPVIPPLGLVLEDVIWDMDREVFLATTSIASSGLPLGEILADLGDRIARGWRCGSHQNDYEQGAWGEHDEPGEDAYDDEGNVDWSRFGAEQGEEAVPARRRSRELNELFNALRRHLAEALDGDIAYAMYKLGRYVQNVDLSKPQGELEERWLRLRQEYRAMPDREKDALRDRMVRARSLDQILRRKLASDQPDHSSADES